jgi:hypothetical protein
MKPSVSSILFRRSLVTVVTVMRRSEYRVDSLNDLTARPIPAAR